MIRTTVFVGMVVMSMSASASYAQDVSSKEILVMDEGCKQQKIAACVAATKKYVFTGKTNKCPQYNDLGQRKNDEGKDVYAVVEDNNYVMHCEFKNNQTVQDSPFYIQVVQHCKTVVENLPATDGNSCLKPLAQERIANAIGTDFKHLIKQLCAVSGNPKCDELDKVPQ
ncbi:hypothetical protein [Rhizobium sp. MHM7A]|uniref:hypothetical protein n=1 Tax=Rhizobium sp. MHM7A TaxID=2583233 RepID=UPI001106E9D7|nr:hypothetical protein [Rhizobium sp. MHM7A]TLX16248.1 hypothetical protein FFR93_02660 [Rhizobium sp. MHM7A]